MSDRERLEAVAAKCHRVTWTGDKFKACCPAHDEHTPSFACWIKEDGWLKVYCSTGCSEEAILAALGMQVSEIRPPREPKRKITLADLAADKGLPAAFLRKLGVHDLPDGGVGIPYSNPAGTKAYVKSRTALAAKEGSFLPKGASARIYGEERLKDLPDGAELLAVEGESDCWTCWYHGFHSLGIPGASNFSKLKPEHLGKVRGLYIIQEPDKGGAGMIANAKALVGEWKSKRAQGRAGGWGGMAFVVRLDGAKDPNELHKQDPERFSERLRAAMAAAVPLDEWEPPSTGQTAAPEPPKKSRGEGESRTTRAELLAAVLAADEGTQTDRLRELVAAVAGDELAVNECALKLRKIIPVQSFRDAARAALRDRKQAQKSAALALADPSPHHYVRRDGRICLEREVTTEVGGQRATQTLHEPLCTFDCEIVAEEVRDDGAEQQTTFILEGRLPSGEALPAVSVSADRFPLMQWIGPAWGNRAVPLAGQGKRDHLRAAIQLLSPDAERRHVFLHTGWRRIGEEWLYLHSGGAVGTVGTVSGVETLLADGKLFLFSLPDPPEGEALREAVSASLALLDLARDEITIPLLAAVFRAPLAEFLPIDLSLFFAGATGCQKSELTALAQAHYGAEFNAKALPAGWDDTANSLSRKAFLAKDAVFVVDDFAPGGTQSDVQRLHREADRLFRGAGNRSGRGRMRPDGSLRPEYFPRGLVVSSGEDLPTGHSVRARLVVVEMTRGDVNLDRLTQAQANARDGFLAMAMAGYVQWIAANADELQRELAAQRLELRAKARAYGLQHDRTPDNAVSLFLGWLGLLDYGVSTRALLPEHAEALKARGWNALLAIAKHQGRHQQAEEPTTRFLALLSACIASGAVHVACAEDNEEPHDASQWGWREREFGVGDSFRREWQPQGARIGWLEGDDLFLEPDAAYAAVLRLTRDQGSGFSTTQQTLWKRMSERELLASRDVVRERNTIRRTVGGERRQVLHLHAETLFAETVPTVPTAPEALVSCLEEHVQEWPEDPRATETVPENRPTNPASRVRMMARALGDPEFPAGGRKVKAGAESWDLLCGDPKYAELLPTVEAALRQAFEAQAGPHSQA